MNMFSEAGFSKTQRATDPHCRQESNRWSNSSSSSRSSSDVSPRELPQKRHPGLHPTQNSSGGVPKQHATPSVASEIQHQARLSPQHMPWSSLRSPELRDSSGQLKLLKSQPRRNTAILTSPKKAGSMASSTHDLLGSSDSPRRGGDLGNSWTSAEPASQEVGSKSFIEPVTSQRRGDPRTAALQRGSERSGSDSNLQLSAPPSLSEPGNEPADSSKHSSRHSKRVDRREAQDLSARGDGSSSSKRRHHNNRKKQRASSQKLMLSEALQKANYAVVLDNAQDVVSATEAYGEACDLLLRVMDRSTSEEEKRKLDTICTTYRNRILELRQNEMSTQTLHEKALPEVPSPLAQDKLLPVLARPKSGATDNIQTARQHLARHQRFPEYTVTEGTVQPADGQENLDYPLQDRSMPGDGLKRIDISPIRLEGDRPSGTPNLAKNLHVSTLNGADVPPPLSPRRPTSPEPKTSSHTRNQTTTASNPIAHNRQITAESTSWLDTIDESAGSSSSSVHSRSSSAGLHRKHIRTGSGATEAEFDAALDAAVEAAYDDGYEPVYDVEHTTIPTSSGFFMEPITSGLHGIWDAVGPFLHEADKQAEFDAISARTAESPPTRKINRAHPAGVDFDYKEHEEKDEEEILEEMRNNAPEDNEYDANYKRGVPRQSDSSGLSGRTWGSSVASMSTSAGTPLSSVAETLALPNLLGQSQKKGPPLPPPTAALPPTPVSLAGNTDVARQATLNDLDKQPQQALRGVRSRRLSGLQNKQLRIDTNASSSPTYTTLASQSTTNPNRSESFDTVEKGPMSATVSDDIGSQYSSGTAKPESTGKRSATPEQARLSHAASGKLLVSERAKRGKENAPKASAPSSPARAVPRTGSHGILKKNFSSSSLKSLRQPNGSPSMSDDSPSLGTHRNVSAMQQVQRHGQPYEAPYMASSATKLTNPSLTPPGSSFLSRDITPSSAATYHSLNAGQPPPLEACPESFLLRPFWLMRAIHQAITHPRGGYVSTRLFMPRDAWRVENVKMRSIDEKVANCDLLTAALLNLSKVDTLDADAVLEELQAFELLLDQVQGQLARKLGAEVGVNGSLSLFKSSTVVEDNGSNQELPINKSVSVGSKSYLPSWKKLRSKSSGASATPSSFASSGSREASKETPTIRPLQMTSSLNVRNTRREQHKVLGIGPYAHYMASLGRLCEAAQILDQIARQVEDPGLRLSSQTHVGLELCARHAAEFFAFFVCRFALSDMGMIMDKYLKRSNEWILV